MEYFSNKKRNTSSGQAVMLAVILFTAGSFIFISGIASPVLTDIKKTNNLEKSKKSFYLSEGSIEDIVYRVSNALNLSSTETLTIDGYTATTEITDTADGKLITATGDSNNLIRKLQVGVVEGVGAAFFFGMQAGVGGVFMDNNSSVVGNIYANGTVVGTGLNDVSGDVVSANGLGLIDNVNVGSGVEGGDAYAHVIQDSYVNGDAYYDSISGTTVVGTLYPGSPDQDFVDLPLTDTLINDWETQAEAGGVYAGPCPYEIDSSVTIGPLKIDCDLIIDKNGTVVNLMGPVWVVGDILTKSGPTIQVDPSFGGKSIPIIADNSLDRETSSKISLENDTAFVGSGTSGSYVLMISQNESAENGGGEIAIDVKNNADGDLIVYAARGEIVLQNNIGLKEVTAYKIHLKNFAEVIYETGLASLLFDAGPGGGFEISSWKEVE